MIVYFPHNMFYTVAECFGDPEWHYGAIQLKMDFELDKTYCITRKNCYFWCSELENLKRTDFKHVLFYTVYITSKDIVHMSQRGPLAYLVNKIKITALPRKII